MVVSRVSPGPRPWPVWLKHVGTFLLLSLDSILNRQDGRLSCLSWSASLAPPVTKVAEVVTVVVAVDPGGVGGVDPVVAVAVEPIEVGDELASCCSSVVLWAFSCCCFVLTSFSADWGGVDP